MDKVMINVPNPGFTGVSKVLHSLVALRLYVYPLLCLRCLVIVSGEGSREHTVQVDLANVPGKNH